VFKEMGRADELGSGVRNIFEYYTYYSDLKPQLEEKDVFYCSVYTDKSKDSENVTENVTENVAENVTEKRLKQLLAYIRENPKITTTALAKMLSVTRMTAHRDLEKLKDLGLIKRVGPDKGGHWEVK
jgi:ATP-dependent DNA helicase RecG